MKQRFINGTIILIVLLNFCLVSSTDPEVSWDALYDYATQQIVGRFVSKDIGAAQGSFSFMPTDAQERALYCSKFKPFFTGLQSVLDLKTFNSLNLIQENGKIEYGVAACIPTKTQGGTVYKGISLAFPQYDVSRAQQLQAAIRTLVEEPALRQQILALYDQLHDAESALLSLFIKPLNPENTSKNVVKEVCPLNNLFFQWRYLKQLNQSPLAMQTLYLANMAAPLASFGFGLASAFYSYRRMMESYGYKTNVLPNDYDNGLFKLPNMGPSDYDNGRFQIPYAQASTIAGGIAGVAGLLPLDQTYHAYVQACTINTRMVDVHQKLSVAATYIRTINALDELVQQHDSLRTNLFLAHNLHDIATKQNCSSELVDVLTQLETETFKTVTFFSYRGRVLTVYYNVQKVIDELVPVLAALSELDVCSGFAQLYVQNQDKKSQYTFATFLKDASTPVIRATNFWNLLVDSSRAVPNSIAIGKPDATDVIVTGINRGGKTTIFKALALNSVLAQAFGIVAAEKWEQTPFALISCYLDVAGSIELGLSAFEAEVHRAAELYNKARALNPSMYGLFILDEVFTGTEAGAGALISTTFAKNMAQMSNICTIFVTHHKALALMGDTLPQIFQNYHVVAHENADGSFTPTYTIQKGISTQNDAFFIAKKAGIM
jgi:hypothetical protein